MVRTGYTATERCSDQSHGQIPFIPAADPIVQMKRPVAAASQRSSSPCAPKDYVICELGLPDMADFGVASALFKVHWRASRDAAV
jgi:hypothetical protein